MFKRRDTRSPPRVVREFVYPPGGWWRASSYIWLRLQRLPDDPHRIARGIAAGVFISFTPLFGLHFLGAAAIARVIRGNILASLIATFAGNPLTTPLIAALSLETGYRILGADYAMPITRIPAAFREASAQLWHNIEAIASPEVAHWDSLWTFGREVFLPYLVGGIGPGLLAAAIAYAVSVPLTRTYQGHRDRKAAERLARAIAREAARSQGKTKAQIPARPMTPGSK